MGSHGRWPAVFPTDCCGWELNQKVASAFALANTPHYPLTCFALWRIRAAGVGMNPLYSLRQLKLITSDAAVDWIVLSDDQPSLAKGRQLAAETGARLIVCRADATDLAGMQAAATEWGEVAFATLLDGEAGDEPLPPSADALAMIQYTGGTTGGAERRRAHPRKYLERGPPDP